MDLGLDPTTGDLIVDGGLVLVSQAEELRQRIEVGLTINLGEFFNHINYGLPWLRNEELGTVDIQYFLGEEDNTTVQYIVKEIDKYLLSIDQITEVNSTYEFDQPKRVLTYLPQITGTDGTIVDFPPYTLEI